MYFNIVVPVFNEEENIDYIHGQIQNSLQDYNYNIVFVDDGSKDGSFEKIKVLSEAHSNVKGISFSRNFGHQTALLAGLSEADADFAIMMDADGQHPAEVIPELIQKHNEGFDIVNTKRLSTADAGLFKRLSSKLYYKLINYLTDIEIEPDSSDFRLMSRKAIDAFLKIDEHDRFTRGLISWMGFQQAIVEYKAPKRFAGTSKYSLKKMIRFGIDGITSFSAKPLRISFYLGLIVLLLAIAYAIYAIIIFYMGKATPGWTSTLLSIMIIGGAQLLSIGILGEYLARIFNEIKRRPHFFVKERCGNKNHL